MTTSSVLTDCSTILNDTVTTLGTGNCDTITISSGGTGSSYYYNTGSSGMGAISISGGGYTIASGSTITLNEVNAVSFNWKNEEFVDCLPDFDRVEKMCKEYPGLAIAFEKFKTVYKLVKDDYDTPKDKK